MTKEELSEMLRSGLRVEVELKDQYSRYDTAKLHVRILFDDEEVCSDVTGLPDYEFRNY